jgi:hypothetical protein
LRQASVLETFATASPLQEKVTAILSVNDTADVYILCSSYYKNFQQFGYKFLGWSTEYYSLK